MSHELIEVIQPWTDGFWVSFIEDYYPFSNAVKYGVAGLFEETDVWIHEFTEEAINNWMKKDYYYISHRAAHVLTSLVCFSGKRSPQGKMELITPDEYWVKQKGKQKKLERFFS